MSITPLDQEFRRAKAMPSTDSNLIKAIIEAVRLRFPEAEIEWDEGAGDTWVMVNHKGKNLVMLNSTIPLAFANPDVANDLNLSENRAVVVVESDLHNRRFSIEPSTLLETINLIWSSRDVDPKQFSLADLSWAAI